MTHNEENQMARDKAAAVIPYLTGTWRLDENPESHGGGLLIGCDENADMTLWFWLYWRDKTRLEIHGGFPNGLASYLSYHGEREKLEITVAVDKDPKRIAQDIERRLMPGYLIELNKTKERKRADDDFKNRRAEMLNKLCEILGDAQLHDHDQAVVWLGNSYPYGRVNYRSDGLEFALTLPVETAWKVAAIIRDDLRKEA